MDEPLGLGSTSRSTPSAAAIRAGDRLSPPPRRRASCRPIASVAPTLSAYARARSSFQAKGWTAIPRSTPTHSVVVNDSTSTTTATSPGRAPADVSRRTGRPPSKPDPVRRLAVLARPAVTRCGRASVGLEPEPVARLGAERLVELVEVAHDVGAELRRAVRVDREVLLGELLAALGPPAVAPS